ncbi:MAG: glycosyltransferase family 4 protein [Lachnospiraceae bacterium]|nr:glycosyltransferase family 4 protein [Lachnospiraceae bacterium]
MRKKILFVFSRLYYGGAERQFRELVTHMDKKKFDLIIVETGNDEDAGLVRQFEQQNQDIRFYYLKDTDFISNSKKKFAREAIFIRYILQMYHVIKKEKPDLILAYNGLEISGSWLFCRLGAKVVFSERESGNRGKRKLKRYKWLFRSVDKIICNSKEAQRYYAENGISSEYIPNGIQCCDRLPLPDKDWYIILVPARITRVKNQKIVLNALSLCENKNYKVIFIGKQEDKEYLEELKQLAQNLNLEQKIEFLNFTNDIQTMYRNCNLVILPSRMEGCTNVLLESYLYGRPCLVSNIIMNRDVANERQEFFETDDAKGLSRLIDMCRQKKESEWRDILESNHQYVIDNFSVEQMVRHYENIFDRL